MKLIWLLPFLTASLLAQDPIGPIGGGGVTNTQLNAAIATRVPNTRQVLTTSPLAGGGNLGADITIALPVATGSVNGYLSSTDWTTFNGKLGSSAIGVTVQAYNANTTTQGNVFNGVSQLLQLNGSGQIPAIDAHLVTGLTAGQIPNLPASKITSGTLNYQQVATGGDGSGTHFAGDDGAFHTLAGGGSVSAFSSGSLSPLFTTSVATSTTTPALSFSLSNAAGFSWFGNAASGSGVPSYNTTVFPASLMPAFTGQVTNSAGSLATTITANTVTYGQIQQVGANSILGNSTGSTANATEITADGGMQITSGKIYGYNTSQSLSGTSPTANAALAKSFYITLSGNSTFTFSNFADGDSIVIRCQQAASGGPYTVTFPTTTWQGGSQPTQTTTANRSDFYQFHKQSTTIYGNATQNY